MATVSKTTGKVQMQAWVPVALMKQAQSISAAAGDATLSDFVRRAIENEVSRASLCKPVAAVKIEDVAHKLNQIHDLLAASSLTIKHDSAVIKSVGRAVGISLPM